MSDIARFGNIPPLWRWALLGEVTSVVRGASPRPKGDPRYFGGQIPWIMISDVSNEPGKYLTKTREGVTQAGADKSRELPSGALILSNSGTVCVPKILRIRGCIHDGFVTFPTLAPSIEKDFLYYWFHYIRPRVIQENKQGITQVNLNTDIVRALPVPIVPPGEQRRIVAKIEELFSDLDAGVAALERVKANLKRYRAAVLKAAVEGRLTEEWRKHNPPTETGEQLLKRILTERRAKWEAEQLRKFAEKGKEPGKGWREKYEPAEVAVRISRDIPSGWAPGTIDQVSWLDVGFAFKSDKFTNDGVRLLRGENIEPGALRWKETRCWPTDQVAEFEHLMVHEGDIILAMDRPIVSAGLKVCRAKAHDIPCLLVQRVARFKPIDAKFTAFLYLAVQTRDFIRHVLAGQTGTQLPHISGQGIATFSFAIPPLAEQAEIVAEVDRRLSVADAAEKQVEAALQRAARLRQAILKRAFEGKLVPQDPADEPVRVGAPEDAGVKPARASRGKRKGSAHVEL